MVSIVARVLLVLLIAAGAGAAALAFSDSQRKEYRANMRLAFGRLAAPEYQLLGPGFAEPQLDENVRIQTEAAAVRSIDVAVATASAAPDLGYTPGQVASHVGVSAIRDTLTVSITAHSSTAVRAARLANVYGRQYIELRRAKEHRQAARVVKALKAQYRALPKADKARLPGAQLRGQWNVVKVLEKVGSGQPQIIESAKPSFAPAGPDKLRNVLFGVLFGLVVGIGLVALRSETRNRFSSAARRGAAPARGDTLTPR